MINYWLNTGCSLIGNLLNQCRIHLNSVSVFSSVNLSIGLARWRQGVSFRWVDLERRPVLENIFRVQSYEISKPHFHLFGRKCHFLALFGRKCLLIAYCGDFFKETLFFPLFFLSLCFFLARMWNRPRTFFAHTPYILSLNIFLLLFILFWCVSPAMPVCTRVWRIVPVYTRMWRSRLCIHACGNHACVNTREEHRLLLQAYTRLRHF